VSDLREAGDCARAAVRSLVIAWLSVDVGDGKTEINVDDGDGKSGTTGDDPSLVAIVPLGWSVVPLGWLDVAYATEHVDDDSFATARDSAILVCDSVRSDETGNVREVSPELR